jgi:hypothetical protein
VWTEAWVSFAGAADSSASARVEARRRARGCLSFAIRGYRDALEDPRALMALHVLRELGEGYALAAESWPMASEAAPALPDRAVLAGALRNAGIVGVDDGDTASPPLHPSSGVLDGLRSAHPSIEHDLAVRIGDWLGMYPTFAAILAADDGRAGYFARRDGIRKEVCVALSLQRRQFYALSHTTLEGPPQGAMLLALLLTDSRFVAAASEVVADLESVPLITGRFALQYLESSGAGAWLDTHDALPRVFAR